eukprot:gnl/Dysnectes_brevis/6236_a9527_318.p1 GENE.gnl/Dysnectes_brevis/6236_a9527_318~~gnl/Dysnectes_brevis/6236_a9527_318.p1  ORF type:complete len:275 (-),score=49.99 gnl/Dysnectes_brevis/6236_a9527_318:507-1331(-)
MSIRTSTKFYNETSWNPINYLQVAPQKGIFQKGVTPANPYASLPSAGHQASMNRMAIPPISPPHRTIQSVMNPDPTSHSAPSIPLQGTHSATTATPAPPRPQHEVIELSDSDDTATATATTLPPSLISQISASSAPKVFGWDTEHRHWHQAFPWQPLIVSTLRQHMGIQALRPLQVPVINAVMSGRDVLAVLPTGAGKTMCFTLPTLMTRGITLVVSPLLALIADQASALTRKGIQAYHLSAASSSSSSLYLYISPRLSTEGGTASVRIAAGGA